ncbi:MAG: tyrosine-protein phosphatase [Rubrivivax sp.]|nr:tyrosine-protein phosphatase [Rubrivivax sp.]
MSTHPRLVPLAGASNFRDLGGYPGHAGRPLRWRRLFRSDHLGALTEADRARLAELGITRTFDFRGVHESAAESYELPGVAQHVLAIEPTVAQQMSDLVASGIPLTAERAAGLMEDLYRHLVTGAAGRYAEWFEHLLDHDEPLVFHCTAGKDRTGVAAALLLRALGVPAEVVEQDYLLTNAHFRAPAPRRADIPEEVLGVLWSVRPAYLHAALAEIDAPAHGGLERYLAERIGLTPAARARLAELYLEPAAGGGRAGA